MPGWFSRERSVSEQATPSDALAELGTHYGDVHERSSMSAGWDSVVVDVETTGLFPGGSDRVVEIAAIRYSPDGDVVDRLDTLVDPGRDVGASHIHGITASDVRDAPTFDSIVGDVTSLMAGAVVVAHNASFDVRFLTAEFQRAGHVFPDTATICTMQLPARVGVRLPAVNLQECCSSFGIDYSVVDAHRAMYDVERTADLYAHLVELAPVQPPALVDLGASEPIAERRSWPTATPTGVRYPRETARSVHEESFGYLQQLASVVGARRGVDPDHAPYVALLDRVLEDGIVDNTETAALIGLARDLGLGESDIDAANRDYLRFLVDAAWEDAIVTDQERTELKRAAHLLGIGAADLDALIEASRPTSIRDLSSKTVGELHNMSVCFTGAMSKPRAELEQLAEDAGLIPRKSVTKTLDILVTVDASSQSGKAVKARTYGTRIISEDTFLRKIGANS